MRVWTLGARLCECNVCVSVCFCGSVVCEVFFGGGGWWWCVCGCFGWMGVEVDCVSEGEYVSPNG